MAAHADVEATRVKLERISRAAVADIVNANDYHYESKLGHEITESRSPDFHVVFQTGENEMMPVENFMEFVKSKAEAFCGHRIDVMHTFSDIDIENGTARVYLNTVHNARYASETSAAVIVLPRGPFCVDDAKDESFVDILKPLLPFVIVQINYRVSREQQFPTPIHDVLTGYDWVKEHLLPKRAITRIGRSEHVGGVAVCGELVGGALAAALALTECRIGQPGIVAAAISNPVLDWVSVGESGHVPSKQSRMDGLVAEATQARDQLFGKPENYFDPFASPMLFLRSPGQAVPSPPPGVPSDDLAHLSYLNREDFLRQHRPPTGSKNSSTSTNEQFSEKGSKKTAKRYPSQALGLRLPPFYISAGEELPFLEQAQEFARRLRPSFIREVSAVEFGRKVLTEVEVEALSNEERSEYDARYDEARNKVQLRTSRDSGMWNTSIAGRARVTEVAEWLKQALA